MLFIGLSGKQSAFKRVNMSLDHDHAASEGGSGYRYDPGQDTRKRIQIGLIISVLFGFTCLTLGTLMKSHALPLSGSRYSGGNLRLMLNPSYIRELLLLLLNVTMVKISVWSSGTAHATALKWTLAIGVKEHDRHTHKRRLEFNSNLRFFQSSYKWWTANGLPANIIMALCLTISYAASSMVLLGMQDETVPYNAVLSFVALYVLGFAILVQSAIAFCAMRTTEIPTWSQSPFDVAAALIEKGELTRRPGRCMHGLADIHYEGPKHPEKLQEAVWVSHPQFRQFTMYTWILVAALYYWTFIMWGMMDSGTNGAHQGSSWDLIPLSPSNNSDPKGEAPTIGMLWGLGILVGFQGGLITTMLQCSESIAAAVSDEHLWREAGTEHGTDPSPGPFKRMFISGHTTAIHISDPVLHWLFGLAVGVNADAGFQIRPVQLLYVALVATAGTVSLTLAGKSRPRTMQPSAYGHLQTMVDLIDEWYPKRMYWGHKHDGHAGTSDKPLPEVDPNEPYGFKDKIFRDEKAVNGDPYRLLRFSAGAACRQLIQNCKATTSYFPNSAYFIEVVMFRQVVSLLVSTLLLATIHASPLPKPNSESARAIQIGGQRIGNVNQTNKQVLCGESVISC
ncbi:uncharacterized protein FOMMEDRAFT_144598 [Fomitiporia mediterranea MF3/22]|uniref:uncharacterized protein n=1 Tax=Fomitiporia mediterranea (strain MF3/22) TaxID=694068 RepID=UPI00044093C0|nr:uncharacterized protein FOMMEDRAFT_144598 [Fomitiporia mediterranea MF3/22]EJD06636.1 hypothetical protein FOMMEDRAFT_144598 [Fomitiporia mediterranea MF3/22]